MWRENCANERHSNAVQFNFLQKDAQNTEAGVTLKLHAEQSRNCVWTSSFESDATFVKTVFVHNIKKQDYLP